jgi:hypothetical protein
MFGHFNWEITITSESVIWQSSKLLIIYIRIIFLDVTNFGVGEHPSNIKITELNITKLST